MNPNNTEVTPALDGGDGPPGCLLLVRDPSAPGGRALPPVHLRLAAARRATS